MNQYEDMYSPEEEITLPCEARHTARIGIKNPYITALPPKRNFNELRSHCITSPGIPTKDEIGKMSLDEQIDAIKQLEDIRMYLPYYTDIENVVDDALVRSYKRRVSIQSNRPYAHYFYQDMDTETCQHSKIKGLGNAPVGFTLLGESGCGKSTGVNRVLAKYPKYIIHNPGTLQQHVQIPIIAVEMPKNCNFHGLYQAIGECIDAILDNNDKVYAIELGRKGDSLEVKFRKLCQLINIFNIGLLIIDEIEHIDKTRVTEGTMETFLSLSNQTGISVGVIGNEDSYDKLFTSARVTRRLGTYIKADNYCSDIEMVHFILEVLYSYLPYEFDLTEDCVKVYFEESNGIIDYILRTFVDVTIEMINGKEISPNTISRVAKSVLKAKKQLEENTGETKIKNRNKTTMENVYKFITEEKDPVKKRTTKLDTGDKLQEVSIRFKEAFNVICPNRFSEADIETALHKIVIKKTDSNETIMQAVFKELVSKETARVKRAEKQKQAKDAVEMLQKIEKETTRITDI